MAKSDDNLNQCSVCKERFVVNSLARLCEMKHDGAVFVREPYVPKPNQRPLKPREES
jgi:hypothetical protein